MDERPLEIIHVMDLRYRWSAGPHLGEFLRGLKAGKILANRCPRCGRHQLPPTPACGRCHVAMGTDWVELSHRGRVISFSHVVDPMYDAGIGGMRQVPYTVASIVLDGAPDVAFFHKLEETAARKVRRGMRVEAVFRPPSEREGSMEDIIHFRAIQADEEEEGS